MNPQSIARTLRRLTAIALAVALVFALPVGSALAADSDGDGVDDSTDNCPGVANADQKDTDGDGEGDACDDDDDGDRIKDALDNCPLAANNDQLNTYGDTRGNACEPESGRRLNGYAAPLIAYLLDNTSAVQIYALNGVFGSKIADTSVAALQGLSAGGVGSSLMVREPGADGVRITYDGASSFTATHIKPDGSTGASAPFWLEGYSFGPGSAPASAGTSASPPTTHIVQRGDTLTAIAKRFGKSISEIVKANHILNPDMIVIGQELQIPR